MSEDSDQELASKKAKASQEDYSDNGFSEKEWDLLQRVLKLDQDVQNVNDRFHREISPMLGKVMETEIPKIMDKAVVHSVSEGSSQEVVDKYLSSLANKLQTVVGPVFEDIVRKSLQTAINTAVEDAVKRQHQQEIEAQRGRLLKEGYDNAVAEKVLKLDQDVQNVNDRFYREISPMLGKVMETEIPKIMDKAVVHSVSEGSWQEVVDKYLSSLANKLQTVVGPVFEDIVRKSLQTAINTAVEDAVKRQHQQEIEAQRGRLLKEGYDNAVAEKFNMENVADYFVKAWIREYLDIMNKGFQVVVDTLLAQSKQSKRMEGEFVYKEKEPPKVLSSGRAKLHDRTNSE
eukprot:g14118.t1